MRQESANQKPTELRGFSKLQEQEPKWKGTNPGAGWAEPGDRFTAWFGLEERTVSEVMMMSWKEPSS